MGRKFRTRMPVLEKSPKWSYRDWLKEAAQYVNLGSPSPRGHPGGGSGRF